jgi:uncharacterized protein YegP (UPF0339 family)
MSTMVFHIYQDVVGQWRWYLSAPNGVKIATAPLGYARRGDCVLAIKRVREASASPMLYDNFGRLGTVGSAAVAASH